MSLYNLSAIMEVYLYEMCGFHLKVRRNTGLYFFMVEHVVDVNDINSIVKFEMKESARFPDFILNNNTW
jgi:hypothetical protein